MQSDDAISAVEIRDMETLRKALEEAREENLRLHRVLRRKERDNRLLSQLHENSECLRKANEEEKKLQYLYNDLLLKNSPNHIMLFDENLRFVLGSESTSLLTDYPSEELLNRPLLQVFSSRLDMKWVLKLQSQCESVLRDNKLWRYNDSVSLGRNGVMTAQVVISPIVEESGRRRGVLIVINDVSELVEARWRAEEAVRSKSAFLANMSHEIRTPMNAIVGIAEILLHDADALSDSQRKYIEDIRISSDSLLTIINDILDLSKLESGKMTLVDADFDFRAMLDNINSLAFYLASEKNLQLDFAVEGEAPACLRGDDVRIRQVLLNIISNAVKFTSEGSVSILVSILPDAIRFRVADTGIGIREEELRLLFEPFSQLDTTRNRQIQGTGLGLSICRNLVELMGGRIDIESVYGKGSTFTVDIPKVLGDPGRLVGQAADRGPARYDPSVRILVVDDNEINLNVASGLLQTLFGLRCDSALSGSEALAMVLKTDYDLIFMDHMMPDMDGVETAARIRAYGLKRATVPIIALTANAVAGTREMLLASCMNDFLAKPIKKEEMADILRRWLPADKRLADGPAEEPAGRTGDSDFVAALRDIEGLDADAGLEAVAGQEDAYAESLRLTVKKAPDVSGKLSDCLRTGELADFCIHAHGMKSSLASIGAHEASRLAKELEQLSAAGDADGCRDRLPMFLRTLESLGLRLDLLFSRGGSRLAPKMAEGDSETLAETLRHLFAALGQYDYDAIAKCLDRLLVLDFGQDTNTVIARLKQDIDMFDYDNARKLLMAAFADLSLADE